MKNFKILGIIALMAVIGFSMAACGDGGGNGNDNNGGYNNGGGGHWLYTKITSYTVTDGVAGSVSSEIEYNWITYRYTSGTNYEYKYTTGSTTYHTTRNGQTSVSTNETAAGTTTQTILYDLATGFSLKSTTTDASGTTAEILYTLQLLSDTGGVKTYKYYLTSTGGTESYTEYKIQNGRTLEAKSYANGVLISTVKYTYTNNTTQTSSYDASNVLLYTSTSTTTNIRGKINWTLTSLNYPSSPASNYSGTFEVVSDSNSALVIRSKMFNADNVLINQTDYHYKKISL